MPSALAAFDFPEARVCVASVGGQLYAFDDACPHAGCSLALGRLDGSLLVCSCHDGAFDVATGEAVAEPAEEPLIVYPVRLQDGVVEVDPSSV
jgi:3-phenylpropionate/trans-cinnamate dioxygenase ferredoxin component